MTPLRATLSRLPARLWIAGRAGVFAGTLLGLGMGMDEVARNGFAGLGYWSTLATVLALKLFAVLALTLAVFLGGALLLSAFDLFTRDPGRSAFVLFALVVLGAGLYLGLDLFLRGGDAGSARHLLRVVRAALETAPPSRIVVRMLLAIAVTCLAGLTVHGLARLVGRIPPLSRWPRYLVTARAARLVLWFASAGPLAAACVLVFATSAMSLFLGRREATPAPDIILISIDTLRADHLGCYGYARPTSPRIDELAAASAVFEAAFAQAPWTLPSHATLFTSLAPSVHRADTYTSRLSPRLLTLAEILRERGYRTMGITSHVLVSDLYGMDQGFARLLFNGGRPAEEITDLALAWIDARRKDRPLFLFLHYFDVHADYDPPEPFRSRFVDPAYRGTVTGRRDDFYANARTPEALAHLRDLYDAEIAYTDLHIGRLLDGLRGRGLFDPALVVLVSDHGEEFLEHGHFEHKTLHDAVLRVPFLVKAPGGIGAGMRIQALVTLADVAPTVLRFASIVREGHHGEGLPMQGRDLTPLLLGGNLPPLDAAFAEQHREVDPDRIFRSSLRTADSRLIASGRGDLQLFDLTQDPAEMTNLLPAAREAADGLLVRLRAIQDENLALSERLLGLPAQDRDRVLLDRQTRERLQALGYLR